MDIRNSTADKGTDKRRLLFILGSILIIGILSIGLLTLLHKEKPSESMVSMGMEAAVTPSPLTPEQKQQLALGTSTETTSKTFTIVGGNFYFRPNRITVNKGDHVTFVFKNAGGQHNLVFPDFQKGTPTILTGQTANVTIIASSAGTYRFICTIAGHVQLGMWGILTVK